MKLAKKSLQNILISNKLSPYINNNTPAFATLIIKNDKTVFKGVQGCAVLKNGKCITKATLDTPFSICSVTKHFTAAAILMLEEEEKLSINDYITKYIPELPSRFNRIKIKHLIFQISGVPNYFESPNIRDFNQMIKKDKKLTEKEVLTFILKSKLKPHNKVYDYSNSGYVLLAKIIENTSNETFAQFVQQRFFNKFGMKSAFVMSSISQHKDHTEAYSSWPLFQPTNWMKVFMPSGDGGIFMSINDFEKWIYAFSHNKIFTKKQTMRKFLSIGKYDNGKAVEFMKDLKYGFGLIHSEENRNGKKYHVIGHNGGMPGSAAEFVNIRNSKENIWVIYLNNAGSYPDKFDILERAKISY